MIEAWSVEDVRAAEERLGDELRSGELMRRAAEGLAGVVAARLPEGTGEPGRVVGLVGPGNNGGDVLHALARLAADGHDVAAVRMAAAHEGGVDALRRAGGVLLGEDAGPDEVTELIGEADVVVDGILGIGGRPGMPEVARAWVAAIDEDAWVVAADVPSGHAPDGLALGADGVFADETVTFGVPKPVHLLPATSAACGVLTVVPIGLDLEDEDEDEDEADGRPAPAVRRLTRDDVAAVWPVPGPEDDKYTRGVVGVVAGGEDYTGAPLLTTGAAVASGAGMVRYVGTPTPESLVRAAVPEAVHGDGRVQAWVVGPGLDVASSAAGSAAQLDVARAALASDLPVVLDAGGLDLLDGPRSAPTLLTPHAGECARMLSRLEGDEVSAEGVVADRLGHARRLARATGAVVLLKGSATLVVPPEEGAPVWVQADAPAWLATAGSGDVLAGILGTLAAAGLPLDLAGALGALVHGVTGDDANPGGPVRAGAIVDHLPSTVAALLTR